MNLKPAEEVAAEICRFFQKAPQRLTKDRAEMLRWAAKLCIDSGYFEAGDELLVEADKLEKGQQ